MMVLNEYGSISVNKFGHIIIVPNVELAEDVKALTDETDLTVLLTIWRELLLDKFKGEKV